MPELTGEAFGFTLNTLDHFVLVRDASWGLLMTELVTEIDTPRVVHVSITSACNWDCIFCTAHNRPGTTYPTETIYRVLDRLAKAGVVAVVLYGGEPTLHPDFINIGKYAKDLGLDVGIITNGARITRENIDKITDVFSSIAVSIHSFRQIHDKITSVSGSFDQAMRALDLLALEGAPLMVNTTVTTLNLFNFDKFIKFLYYRYPQILGFVVNRATFTGRNKEYTLNRAEIVEVVRRVKVLKDNGIPLNLGVPIPPCILPTELKGFATFCSAGVLFADITGDGLVRPCSNVGQNDILGNILDEDLRKLWNSEKIVKFRSYTWAPEQCRSCTLFTNCFGGCKRAPNGTWRIDPIAMEPYEEFYVANPYNRIMHVNNVEAIMSNMTPAVVFEEDDLEKVKKILAVLKEPLSLAEVVEKVGMSQTEAKVIIEKLLELMLVVKVYRKNITVYNTSELFSMTHVIDANTWD